jgi:NAD(P)-dependent dehydrogenase (short-subunit alcohol dehydrogenase family)
MSPRTALITGANRGIGREIARQLAAAAMTVVIGARDPRLGEEAALATPGEVRAEQLDVTDPGSVEACGRRLAHDGVEIDVLVNNAGLYTTTPLLAIDEVRLMEALGVNLIGAWRTCREFVPARTPRTRPCGWPRSQTTARPMASSTAASGSRGRESEVGSLPSHERLAGKARRGATRDPLQRARPHVGQQSVVAPTIGP